MPASKQPGPVSDRRADGPSAGGPADPGLPRWPIAVAVHRGDASGTGPRVVASGRGAVAEQILNVAFAHGVRVREDADLAAILAAVEVDCEIPLDALAAVAEILSYVYRANAQAQPQSEPRVSEPQGETPQ